MAQATQVKGYKETMRSLNKMEKETKKAVRDGLKKAAEPIASQARSNLAGFAGISLGTIGPKVTVSGVSIIQRARKTTGKRGDFGGLQMTQGLIPAAYDTLDDTVETVEDAFWRLAREAGF